MNNLLFKRIAIFVVILASVFTFSWYLLKNQIGDIKPSVFPRVGEIEQTLDEQKVGEEVSIPLNLPEGFQIGIFVKHMGTLRDLHFTPGGTLLVSEMDHGKVWALQDKDNDGVAEVRVSPVTDLSRPHGITFYNDKLFVSDEVGVYRYSWDEAKLEANLEKKILTLPTGARHFTRSLVFDDNGRLFVSLGSSCDTCYEKHEWLAAVIVTDQDGNNPRVYSKGLRNAVYLAKDKENRIWATEMGRDFLGDNLPPDEINILKDGGDFGWPVCYGNQVHDTSFDKSGKSCSGTEKSVYNLPAHSAPLGLSFINSSQFPVEWQGDLLVAYHGSWNRSVPTGYKLVRLDVEGDMVVGESDFLTGFLVGSGALGRPVDTAFDTSGSLYISDDKSGVIYKVIKSTP